MTRTQGVRLCGFEDPTYRVDPDGMLTISAIAGLPDSEATLAGLVVNLFPVTRRAWGARYALDRHGCDAPIGLGSDVVPLGPNGIPESREMPWERELEPSRFEADPGTMTGRQVCEAVLAEQAPGSVDGFFTSPLPDAAWLVEQPHLWRAFRRVAVMGGVDADWEPDNSFNNRLDAPAAVRFYRGLRESGTPVTIVDRTAALWAKVPMAIWVEAAASADPWVAEMGASMLRQPDSLFNHIVAGNAPGRTPEWFLDYWCNGARPEITPGMSILKHVDGLPVYDLLTVATLLTPEPLGHLDEHPEYPNFRVLRPDPDLGPGPAIEAQIRLVRAAFGPNA